LLERGSFVLQVTHQGLKLGFALFQLSPFVVLSVLLPLLLLGPPLPLRLLSLEFCALILKAPPLVLLLLRVFGCDLLQPLVFRIELIGPQQQCRLARCLLLGLLMQAGTLQVEFDLAGFDQFQYGIALGEAFVDLGSFVDNLRIALFEILCGLRRLLAFPLCELLDPFLVFRGLLFDSPTLVCHFFQLRIEFGPLRLLPGLLFLGSPFPLLLLLLELLAMIFQCGQAVLLLGLRSPVGGCGSTRVSTGEGYHDE
jgi:hypothetical protein